MAGIKINQYPLERLIFGDDDYYDIDYWNGAAFETAKIKGSVIKAAIQAGIISNNLFTADLNLLANRLHTLNDKELEFTTVLSTGNTGRFRIKNDSISGYLRDTVDLSKYSSVNQQVDAFIASVEDSTYLTTFGVSAGLVNIGNSSHDLSLDAVGKLTSLSGNNGSIQIGDPTNNTNTHYRDLSTNKYGILYINFGEASPTDSTGANYSTLIDTSLVPKKYVDDAIASTPAGNISNSNLTFAATYYADLNGNDWSIKNGSDTYFNIENDGSFTIGKDAQNLSTNTASKYQNTVIGSQSIIASASINQATSIGYNNTVNSSNGLALGHSNNTTNGISIGTSNTNTSYLGLSIGSSNIISNTGVISVGVLNQSSSAFATMLGWRLNPLHDHVTMLGRGDSNLLKSTASKQFIVGWDSAIPTILIGATSDSYIKSTGILSLETNTVIKGSNNAVGTSGFKVTDVNNLSLLDIKNDGSFIIGKGATNNNVLSKNQNVVIGQNATIGAGNSEKAISIGYNASATLTNSIAIGGTSTNGGVSMGVSSVAGGVAVALLGSATSDFSIGIGSGASSSNTGAISIGKSAIASGQYTTSLGYEAESTSNFATALGWNTESNAYMGLALGSATEVNHAGSIVLGTGFSAGASALVSTATNQLTVGFNSATPTMVIGATSDSYIKSTGNLSLETDTTVKGSDTSASTTGFKVTDSANASLLDVRNNGYLSLPSLPSLSTGVGAGDVWSQNGTLRIGSAAANIQTNATITTLTPNADTTKMEIVSALSNTLTIATPTGTPTEAQELTFRIKDNGTARLVVWDAIFEDYTGSLPSTTIANKTVYVGCKYNAIDTKWDVVAVQNQP